MHVVAPLRRAKALSGTFLGPMSAVMFATYVQLRQPLPFSQPLKLLKLTSARPTGCGIRCESSWMPAAIALFVTAIGSPDGVAHVTESRCRGKSAVTCKSALESGAFMPLPDHMVRQFHVADGQASREAVRRAITSLQRPTCRHHCRVLGSDR